MTSFPISNLPRHLIEKIFAKTDTKSNFRLRQTCHDVHDLITSSPNITVSVEGSFMIEFNNSIFQFYKRERHENILIEVEGFHGARLQKLSLLFIGTSAGEEAVHQLLYSYFGKHRITCDAVDRTITCSKELLTAILKILKPVKVSLDLDEELMERFDPLEVVIGTKTVSIVEVIMYFYQRDVAFAAMGKLLLRFTEVDICFFSGPSDQQDILSFFKEALTRLLNPTPFKKFRLNLFGQDRASEDVLKQAYPELNWIVNFAPCGNDSEQEFATDVQLPSSFPQGSSCSLTVHNYTMPAETSYTLCYNAGNSMM